MGKATTVILASIGVSAVALGASAAPCSSATCDVKSRRLKVFDRCSAVANLENFCTFYDQKFDDSEASQIDINVYCHKYAAIVDNECRSVTDDVAAYQQATVDALFEENGDSKDLIPPGCGGGGAACFGPMTLTRNTAAVQKRLWEGLENKPYKEKKEEIKDLVAKASQGFFSDSNLNTKPRQLATKWQSRGQEASIKLTPYRFQHDHTEDAVPEVVSDSSATTGTNWAMAYPGQPDFLQSDLTNVYAFTVTNEGNEGEKGSDLPVVIRHGAPSTTRRQKQYVALLTKLDADGLLGKGSDDKARVMAVSLGTPGVIGAKGKLASIFSSISKEAKQMLHYRNAWNGVTTGNSPNPVVNLKEELAAAGIEGSIMSLNSNAYAQIGPYESFTFQENSAALYQFLTWAVTDLKAAGETTTDLETEIDAYNEANEADKRTKWFLNGLAAKIATYAQTLIADDEGDDDLNRLSFAIGTVARQSLANPNHRKSIMVKIESDPLGNVNFGDNDEVNLETVNMVEVPQEEGKKFRSASRRHHRRASRRSASFLEATSSLTMRAAPSKKELKKALLALAALYDGSGGSPAEAATARARHRQYLLLAIIADNLHVSLSINCKSGIDRTGFVSSTVAGYRSLKTTMSEVVFDEFENLVLSSDEENGYLAAFQGFVRATLALPATTINPLAGLTPTQKLIAEFKNAATFYHFNIGFHIVFLSTGVPGYKYGKLESGFFKNAIGAVDYNPNPFCILPSHIIIQGNNPAPLRVVADDGKVAPVMWNILVDSSGFRGA